MLNHISIRDFAIIEKLDLTLSTGLTVLTGETGAGKSIVVDALSLVLGERADPSMIRHGAEQSDISADFELAPSHPAHTLLEELALAEDGACLLRRTISHQGRSRAFINGRPASLQQLKQLGDHLADIYGQHEHQSLMQPEIQRELLDAYAGIQGDVQTLKRHFRAWKEQRKALDELETRQKDRQAQLELLNYQLAELDRIDPKIGELETLENERARLAAAGQLQQTAAQALEQLYEGESAVSDILGAASRKLAEHSRLDETLQPIAALVDNALIQVDEAASALRAYLSHLNTDPRSLDQVGERLDHIHGLLRKHQCDYPALLAKRQKLSTEREQFSIIEEHMGKARNMLAEAAGHYQTLAKQISQARQHAGQAFGQAVSPQMHALGMAHGRFEVRIDRADAANNAAFRPHGLDQVEFLVSANPGQPAKALNKVASGGEISRISLAIQVILAGQGLVDTLVFDEVDVGIGGAVAEIVGRKLRGLGKNKQILCVTHLPQVATQGHQHLRVRKASAGDHTQSSLVLLDQQTRVEEIARMLGGVEITPQTLATASEMLAMVQDSG